MRLGIFGGTFNPIHIGHLIAAEEIRQNFQLQRIIFVPSARPPHKPSPELIDPMHRLEMTRLAIQGNAYFDISSVELERRDFSYTVETIKYFRREWGASTLLFFISGIDAFSEIDTWHAPERLIGLCDFIVVSRPEFSLALAHRILSKNFGIQTQGSDTQISLRNGHTLYLAEITPVGISSTLIREHIREGRSVKYLLPESVESYIVLHRLYQNES